MPATTTDHTGLTVATGDRVRVLDIAPDPDLDEDDLDMFMDMVGAICNVERIDDDGTAWVAMWWNGSEGTVTTLLGLAPSQIARLDA